MDQLDTARRVNETDENDRLVDIMTVEDHQRPLQDKIVDHQAVDEELGLRKGVYP